MITNPQPLTTLEALLLCVCAAAAALAYLRLVRRRLVAAPEAVAVALLASVAVTVPFTAWSIVSDARAAGGYSARAAARVGPEDNGVDTSVVDRVARIVPPHGRYAIVFAPSVGTDRATVFDLWALTALLPRIAVREPRRGDWVVAVGAPPVRLGVDARDVTRVPSRRHPELTTWVGRSS